MVKGRRVKKQKPNNMEKGRRVKLVGRTVKEWCGVW